MDLEETPTQTQFTDAVLENAIDHRRKFYEFEGGPRSEVSAVFGQLMTRNGLETAEVRVTSVDTTGFEAFAQEDTSLDKETDHLLETFGFMALDIGDLVDKTGAVIGEVGRVIVPEQDDVVKHTQLFQNEYVNPVVIMRLNTQVGFDGAHMRVEVVNGEGFEYILEEWSNHNPFHQEETAVFLVVEAGTYEMADNQKLEAQIVPGVTHQVTNILLQSDFLSTPVILSDMQTRFGLDPSIVRQLDPLPFEVSFFIQEEEALSSTAHVAETVGVVALGH